MMAPVPADDTLRPGFGLVFHDLYRREGLARLDAAFLDWLATRDAALADAVRAARAAPDALGALPEADLLIALSPSVDAFFGELFGIGDALAELGSRHAELAPLYRVKYKFVKRQALLRIEPAQLEGFDPDAARARLVDAIATAGFGSAGVDAFDELDFARAVLHWQSDAEANGDALELATLYAAWAAGTEAGQAWHRRSVLFRHPRKTEPQALVRHKHAQLEDGVVVHTIDPRFLRRRLDNGRGAFSLTDPGTDLRGALDEAHYCILCHHQGKDSCSKGLRDKPAPDGRERFRESAFGVKLHGCPLDERISEMHEVKRDGLAIAALAFVVVDNPLCAATGHRICNDCMKSCIYQKQTPVDIPLAETRTLKDVLELPWGFEIYSLLTRWNPLNLRRPLPQPATGRRVLVVGMGPAGFTLAHHLINDGHEVLGVDGLKIEPLPPALCGVGPAGERVDFEPVRDASELVEDLGERVMAGFGGVAEYGITVRWDKNFLKIIRLLLERREQFALAGGVRFGGTLGVDDAWALGFDHVALAMGAGRPTMLDIPNGLARGVRTASDFLMALQLTGAAKSASIANMQLRLPVVVVGGGLTAIDTATESLAYYAVQVEKFLDRHEVLCASLGEAQATARWGDEEREIAAEFIAHARAIRAEREQARREGRPARIVELLQAWGGVTIAYRRRLIDSPSYTLNHEEVEHALQEGVRFAEGLAPVRIEVDPAHAVRAIVMTRQRLGEDGLWRADGEVELAARTVFIAAGTHPNTVLAREEAANFALDGRHFQAVDEHGRRVEPEYAIAKPAEPLVLLARRDDERFVSFFGDLHPSYFGNVVRAMGSAKQGYPVISRVLGRLPAPASDRRPEVPSAWARAHLGARVHRVERLTPTIVEVVVHAPMAARRFEPGQFYRLQNFESLAARVDAGGPAPTRLAMEGLAMTGAWVDKDQGLVSVIALEVGGSSDLCQLLRPDEPVVLMGPTGSPTEIPAGETLLLAGGGLGNAVLFSIGAAARGRGCRVLYFAAYRKREDRYKVAEIEAAADLVVWCCDEAPGFEPGRPQDRSFVGNVVQAMQAYARGDLREDPDAPRLHEVTRLIAIGSDRMMAAVAAARHGPLAPFLDPAHFAIGSINSPMQCMLKEICAQCLQPQRDPATGRTRLVFSCSNQDQPLDWVDFDALHERLAQNSLQEKQTAHWVARCIRRLGEPANPAPAAADGPGGS